MKVCAPLSRRPRSLQTSSYLVVAVLTVILLLSASRVFPGPKDKGTVIPPMAKPEAVGFSADLPQKVHDVIKKHIDAGDTPGVIVLVARSGKVVDWEAQGVVDTEKQMPMQRDLVFWIASMTKPVAAVSVMMMMEAGRLSLGDPISKFLPAFNGPAKVRVLKPGSPAPPTQGQQNRNAPKPQYDLVPANRPITIKDLLTHTSGIQSIGVPKDEVPPEKEGETLASWVSQLGGVPLDFQPGTKWAYSNAVGFNILARIVEVTSGQTFDNFVKERILDPLGMKATSFGPRPDLESRTMNLENPSQCASGKTLFCGTAGLWLPADDYWRFSEMLLNKGSWNGKRLLKASTVEQMTTNQVGDLFAGFTGIPATGMGFGYSMEVVLDHSAANLALPNGSFGWNGVGTRQFWVMPSEKTILIMFLPSGKAPVVHRDIESAVVGSIEH